MSRIPSADEVSLLTIARRLFEALGDETVYSFYARRALSRRCTYRLKLSKPFMFQGSSPAPATKKNSLHPQAVFVSTER